MLPQPRPIHLPTPSLPRPSGGCRHGGAAARVCHAGCAPGWRFFIAHGLHDALASVFGGHWCTSRKRASGAVELCSPPLPPRPRATPRQLTCYGVSPLSMCRSVESLTLGTMVTGAAEAGAPGQATSGGMGPPARRRAPAHAAVPCAQAAAAPSPAPACSPQVRNRARRSHELPRCGALALRPLGQQAARAVPGVPLRGPHDCVCECHVRRLDVRACVQRAGGDAMLHGRPALQPRHPSSRPRPAPAALPRSDHRHSRRPGGARWRAGPCLRYLG